VWNSAEERKKKGPKTGKPRPRGRKKREGREWATLGVTAGVCLTQKKGRKGKTRECGGLGLVEKNPDNRIPQPSQVSKKYNQKGKRGGGFIMAGKIRGRLVQTPISGSKKKQSGHKKAKW